MPKCMRTLANSSWFGSDFWRRREPGPVGRRLRHARLRPHNLRTDGSTDGIRRSNA